MRGLSRKKAPCLGKFLGVAVQLYLSSDIASCMSEMQQYFGCDAASDGFSQMPESKEGNGVSLPPRRIIKHAEV